METPPNSQPSKNKEEEKKVILPKVQEYIDRINNEGETLESFGEIPESWKQTIRENTTGSIKNRAQDTNMTIEEHITRTFNAMAEGAKEGLNRNFQEKVSKYVQEIKSGTPEEKVFEGLPDSFTSAIKAKLLESEIKELYKPREILDLESYFKENTQSTSQYKYNPDLFEGSMTLRELEKDLLSIGADKVQAHGMSKGNIGDQFKSLLDILQNGTDKNRNNGILYTGPLVIDPELTAGMGAAIGTSGGTAYTDGGFILVAKKDRFEIKSADDIGGVLVNEEVFRTLPEIVSKLQNAFPELSIKPYSKSLEVVSDIIKKP